MTAETLPPLVLSVVIVLALVFSFFGETNGNPFTALGRAKRHRQKLLNMRMAELIARGYSDYSAKNAAQQELEEEAQSMTRELRRAGVER